MELKQYINNEIDNSFNNNKQIIEYFVKELNEANLGLTQEQAQHLFNIVEYVCKYSAKQGAITALDALNESLKSESLKNEYEK